MTVRQYTPEEKARLVGGLSEEDWNRSSIEFERVVRWSFERLPVMTQAAALHGLLCGNQELQDALDTIEHVCKQQPVPMQAPCHSLSKKLISAGWEGCE
jgi:hypothetical protein